MSRQEFQMERDISSAILKGENDHLEFKSSLRYDYFKKDINSGLEAVVLKSIAGFLNSKGGRLIIGVSDDGEVLGLKKDIASLKKRDEDGFELKIYELIYEGVGAEFCQFIFVFFYHINDNVICVLDIEKSKTPAYVKKKGVTTFYLRIGNSTKPLTVEETVNYINMEKNVSISN